MLLLLVAHGLGVLAASFVGAKRGMRAGLAVAALAPAASAVWAIWLLANNAAPSVRQVEWVEGLDIAIRLRSDSLALLMTLLVSGIGVAIFVYAIGYFSPDADGAARFPATLLAFSASMLGLVLADSVWTLLSSGNLRRSRRSCWSVMGTYNLRSEPRRGGPCSSPAPVVWRCWPDYSYWKTQPERRRLPTWPRSAAAGRRPPQFSS